MTKTKQEQEVKPLGWAQAFRDVLVQAINKGQLPVLLMGLVALVGVARMPRTELGKLATQIVELLHSLHILGWALTVFLVFAWFFHVRSVRKMYDDEIERLSDVRTGLQVKQLGGFVQSSNGETK